MKDQDNIKVTGHMGSGYVFIDIRRPPYLIADETEYFAVYEDYHHIASFKTFSLAEEYVVMKFNRDQDSGEDD